MNARALANNNNGSPSAPGVSIAASFTFSNGTPITINSGDLAQLKQGVVHFSITEPVVLGSVSEFVGWLTKKFELPDINQDIQDLQTEIGNNPILKSLLDAFNSFYNGTITITVLSLDRTQTDYAIQFAVTLDLNPPVNFFDFITFDSIGVAVNTSGKTAKAA